MGNSLGRPISNNGPGPKRQQQQNASFLSSSSSESTRRADQGKKDEAKAKIKQRDTIKLRRGEKDRRAAAATEASSAGAETANTNTTAADIDATPSEAKVISTGAGTSMTEPKVRGGDAGGSGEPPQDTAGEINGDDDAGNDTDRRPQDAPPLRRPAEESDETDPEQPDAAGPDLTSAIPFALPLLPSKQAVKYFTTCKAWGQAGSEVLPSLVSQELRPVLPPRLVRFDAGPKRTQPGALDQTGDTSARTSSATSSTSCEGLRRGRITTSCWKSQARAGGNWLWRTERR